MSQKKPRPNHELIYERLATLVQQKRKEIGFSKSGLAQHLSLHRAKLAAIEKGSANLYIEEVDLMIEKLDLDPAEVWPQFDKGKRHAPRATYTVDVPANAGESVNIVVNLVEGGGKPKNG